MTSTIQRARKFGEQSANDVKMGSIAFFCPGCHCLHVVATKAPLPNGAVWFFNNNFEKPTFKPSINITTGSFAMPGYTDPDGIPPTRCHTFVTDGKIQFLNDCTHELKGQTIDLPPVPPLS